MSMRITVTHLRIFNPLLMVLSAMMGGLCYYLGIYWLGVLNAFVCGMNLVATLIAWTVLKP
jgi:hypothetical protein